MYPILSLNQTLFLRVLKYVLILVFRELRLYSKDKPSCVIPLCFSVNGWMPDTTLRERDHTPLDPRIIPFVNLER